MGTSNSILITGAAGNLGGLLARHLVPTGARLRLMYHRRPLPRDLAAAPNVTPVQADLGNPATLDYAVGDADVVVHFAGVLFAARPEHFLPITNTQWFENLMAAVLRRRARRIILVSFPHVEGPTSPERPATGRLDAAPISVHAQTRLAEERLLFERTRNTQATPIVLRLGMVYGRGILMIEAARWLARRRLLGVWREPTLIQLVSTTDFLRATTAAILKPAIAGIYHIGDQQPVTLQHFLDTACKAWGYAPPWRIPLSLIMLAATLCEVVSASTGLPAPLTRDFIRIGRVPYWGDTSRTRAELIPDLVHPTLASGIGTL